MQTGRPCQSRDTVLITFGAEVLHLERIRKICNSGLEVDPHKQRFTRTNRKNDDNIFSFHQQLNLFKNTSPQSAYFHLLLFGYFIAFCG